MDAHRVLPAPDHLHLEGALEAALRLQKGVRKFGPAPRGPPRTRSSEALDADAREIERLARRVEQHSQRMAELLRRGVLEPSLAYAFLMTKGGQRIPQAKSKAKARANSRATTSEGAEAAPDTSPPRLPPERPPMVFTRGETMEPFNAGLEVRTLDIASWLLHKNDSQDLRCFFLNDTEVWLCTRITRTKSFFFFFFSL